MDPIWVNLPDDLALKIIGYLSDIDIRLAFGIPPRRLVINKQINFRSKFVYDNFTKTMYDFSGMSEEPPYWIMRRGISFSQFRRPNVFVFNMEFGEYEMTMFSDDAQLGPTKCSNHIVLKDKVKFLLRYGPRDMGKFTTRISF